MSRPQQAAGEAEWSTFTIDSENNIAAHAEVPAGSEYLQSFASEKELAKLAGEWPGSRLVEVWNSFAGVAPFDDLKPVKKFTNRKAALARIWAAVQRLSPDGAQPAADVAPAKAKSKKSPTKAPERARTQKGDESRSNKKAEEMHTVLSLAFKKGSSLIGVFAPQASPPTIAEDST